MFIIGIGESAALDQVISAQKSKRIQFLIPRKRIQVLPAKVTDVDVEKIDDISGLPTKVLA